MWKQLLEFGKGLASLVRKSEQHDEEIKAMQDHNVTQDERLDKLTETVQQLTFAFQHNRDMSERERENLLLRLENAMLRFERRLPRLDNKLLTDEDET